MASKQPRKQAKSAAKPDAGDTNKTARNRQRAPRWRVTKARSGSAATQTSSIAVPAAVAPEGASESTGLSKNTMLPPEDQASQPASISQGGDLATTKKLCAHQTASEYVTIRIRRSAISGGAVVPPSSENPSASQIELTVAVAFRHPVSKCGWCCRVWQYRTTA
jgi:hypothetical protein